MEFSLLGAVIIAVVPLYAVVNLENKLGNNRLCHRSLTDLAISAVLAGVVVGRLSAMILDGVNPLTHPADILIIRGGVATVPATIAALVTVAWYSRDALWPVLDSLAAPALAGLSGWHAGCVIRGSCLGTSSDLPWAVAQSGSDITRHPVEIYAAIALGLGAFGVVLLRRRRVPASGIAAGAALAWASAVRLATEPLRPSLGNEVVVWYTLGVGLGLALSMWSARAATEQPTGATDCDN